MTEPEWRQVVAHLTAQGFVVERVDRATGRIMLRLPGVDERANNVLPKTLPPNRARG